MAPSGAVAASSSYLVLHAFSGGLDGSQPQADLTMDSDGNLYGTTVFGGAGHCSDYEYGGCGVVFRMKHTNQGWIEEAIYSFQGKSDGQCPSAGVVLDSAGNVYGTTSWGGAQNGTGTVFELSPTQKRLWTIKVLYTFAGGSPNSNLVLDKAGNLYGTTGAFDRSASILFQLSPNPNGSWTETTLHTFSGAPDGWATTGNLVLDENGNIYGSTQFGGMAGCNTGKSYAGCGTVYQVSPGTSGWTESILYNFALGRAVGRSPSGGLLIDSIGSLYGSTSQGGNGIGEVFRLAPSKKGGWQESVLYRFFGGYLGPDGEFPIGRLAMNDKEIVGATSQGGRNGLGTVFRVQLSGAGPRERVLYTFANGSNGSHPKAGVILGSNGAVYGTTYSGGGGTICSGGCGVVYEIKP